MPEKQGDIEQIKEDIMRAREWAYKYFNVDGPDGLLDRPVFKVIIGEPDEIIVYPQMYGRAMHPGVCYRLCWKDDGLYWRGQHPFYADKTWLLKIT